MESNSNIYNLDYALQEDKKDELLKFRGEFYLNPNIIYMDGNSLGLLSKRSEASVLSMLDSWKNLGIEGWTKGEYPWFTLSELIGGQLSSLLGADKNEVIATGSTTVNLHQLAASFFQPSGKRTKILADELNFPSDIYALKSQLILKGLDPDEHLVQVQSSNGLFLNENDIINAMSDDVALIVLPSVLYRSGQILDMEYLTKEAHKRGIIIGFDLCHSIGAIPHSLSEWDVDFAFFCTYKHLNGGPGSVAGLYVNSKHFNRIPGLAGWFSSNKSKQFDMDHTLTPAENSGAFQIGTPHILSLSPLIGSISMFQEAGIDAIRKKSLNMTRYFLDLFSNEFKGDLFTIASPLDDKKRGGHVFIEHPDAARICKALKAEGVIPDFRAPNGIRLAPIPLYNTFEDIWNTVQILKKVMKEETYKKFENKRDVVA